MSRVLTWRALLTLAALAALPAVPGLPRYYLLLAFDALLFGAIAMSLDLLMGYTGLVSFGHAAFYGLGAYATAILMERGVLSLWACLGFSVLVVLDGHDLEIGRSIKCDLSIDQESVSRKHARITWDGARYKIADLGSTNGSYVNDELAQERVLRDGDQLKIGRTIFKFIVGGNVESVYYEEIYRLMTVDGLTDLHNKRYFTEAMEKELSRAKRYERTFSLVLFDIDHFKKINDTYGHLAGDSVLRQLGALVKGRVRHTDRRSRTQGNCQ